MKNPAIPLLGISRDARAAAARGVWDGDDVPRCINCRVAAGNIPMGTDAVEDRFGQGHGVAA